MPTPGSVKAGNAFIEIEAIDKTSSVLNTVGYNMFRFARNIENVGRSLTLLGVVTSLPAFLSVARFSNFDNVMRRVQARTQGTVDEMKSLRAEAKRLGQETSVTATRIGEMMGILGQKGFTRKQILGSIQALANLSIATGEGSPFDHEFAAKALTGTMAAFGVNPEDAEEVAKVADKLTAAVNASNFTMEELSVTMSYAGTIAKLFNLSLDETLALTGQLRNLNIEASSAGTALRNMLSEISEQKNRDVLNTMLQGFGSKFQLNPVDELGNLKSLPGILFDLGDAMKELGTAQQGEIMTKLFGKRSMVPAMALSRGKNPFQDLLGAIQASEGLAERTRKQMEAGITGTIERVLGALDALAQTVGEVLSPALVDLGSKIESLLVDMATWITNNKDVIYTYTALVLGTTALGLSMIVLGIHLKAVALLVGILGGALTILAVTMRAAVYPMILAVNTAVLFTQVSYGLILAIRSSVVWFVIARTTLYTYRAAVLATNITVLIFEAALVSLNAVLRTIRQSFILLKAVTLTATLLGWVSTALPYLLTAGAAIMAIYYAFKAVGGYAGQFSQSIDILSGRVQVAFDNLWINIARRGAFAFKSLTDAWNTATTFLELGDVESAWNVALLAMEVVWYETLAGLGQAWIEFDTALNLTSIYNQVIDIGKGFWTWVEPIVKATNEARKLVAWTAAGALSKDWDAAKAGNLEVIDKQIKFSREVLAKRIAERDAAGTDEMRLPDGDVLSYSTLIGNLEKAIQRLEEDRKEILGLDFYDEINKTLDAEGKANTENARKWVESQQKNSETAQFNLEQYRQLAEMKRKQRQIEEEARNTLEENKTNPADYTAPTTLAPAAVASISEVKSLNALAYKSIEAARAAYENANRSTMTQEQLAQAQLKELQKLNRKTDEALEEIRAD